MTAKTTELRDFVANTTDAAWQTYYAAKKAAKPLRSTDRQAYLAALDAAEKTLNSTIKNAEDAYYAAVQEAR